MIVAATTSTTARAPTMSQGPRLVFREIGFSTGGVGSGRSLSSSPGISKSMDGGVRGLGVGGADEARTGGGDVHFGGGNAGGSTGTARFVWGGASMTGIEDG